nr:uncharacterized protein LOC123760046 isoform X2 [Procambarus clarkii]
MFPRLTLPASLTALSSHFSLPASATAENLRNGRQQRWRCEVLVVVVCGGAGGDADGAALPPGGGPGVTGRPQQEPGRRRNPLHTVWSWRLSHLLHGGRQRCVSHHLRLLALTSSSDSSKRFLLLLRSLLCVYLRLDHSLREMRDHLMN